MVFRMLVFLKKAISQTFEILRRKPTLILLFFLAPFIVYYDVLILGHTISFNEASTNFSEQFGKLLPVLDPAAGSQQDHPWLFYIGTALRQGSIPLVNLENGLGALLLESLQSGVFYPLNGLLIFMNLSSPQFFNLFEVFHVLILSINTFLLFRLYISWKLAIALSAAFSLSWLSFFAVNMVHYRAFVWTPLIAWAAVKILREAYSKRTILIGVFATICCLTAGNPQETFFDVIAVLVFVVAELLRSLIESRRIPWRSLFVFSVSLASGLLIGSPSVYPYLASNKAGLLNSLASPARSGASLSPEWLTGWIIPYINGAYADYFRPFITAAEEMTIFAMHPIFIFLVIIGIILCLTREFNSSSQSNFLVFLLFGIIGILTIASFSPLPSLFTKIPFVNTIRMTKYVSYIYLLFSTSGVIALSTLSHLPVKTRRRVTVYALIGFVSVISLIVCFHLADPRWNFNWVSFGSLLQAWIGWAIAIIILVSILLFSPVELNWKLFLYGMILTALLMRPYGFFNAFSTHAPFPVAGIDLSQERILSNADQANTNLLRGYERVEVFDPILNRSFADLMNKNFSVLSGVLHLQLPKGVILSPNQMALLQLMGVTSIYGYQVTDSRTITPVNDSFSKVNNPLPKVFLLSSTAAVETHCQSQDYLKALSSARSLLISSPQAVHKGINHIQFELAKAGSGTLVSLQAFSPGWSLNGVPASKFCGAFNGWQGTFDARQAYTLRYVPLGLRTAYGFAIAGVILLLSALAVTRPISDTATLP